MRRALVVALLMLVDVGVASCHGAPVIGEILAKIVRAERVRESGLPYTIYTAIVFRDSSYVGQSVAPGDSVELWTPGGDAIVHLDGPNPLSTVTMVPGEKIFGCYQMDGGKLFIVDKWTVWRAGAPRLCATPQEREDLAKEDVELEALLADRAAAATLPDSLALFHTATNLTILANPVPGPNTTWRDYGLLARSDGSLRSIVARIRSMRSKQSGIQDPR